MRTILGDVLSNLVLNILLVFLTAPEILLGLWFLLKRVVNNTLLIRTWGSVVPMDYLQTAVLSVLHLLNDGHGRS